MSGSSETRSHSPRTISEPLMTTRAPGAAAKVMGLPSSPETVMWTDSR